MNRPDKVSGDRIGKDPRPERKAARKVGFGCQSLGEIATGALGVCWLFEIDLGELGEDVMGLEDPRPGGLEKPFESSALLKYTVGTPARPPVLVTGAVSAPAGAVSVRSNCGSVTLALDKTSWLTPFFCSARTEEASMGSLEERRSPPTGSRRAHPLSRHSLGRTAFRAR